MTTAYSCLLIAIFLPLVWAMYAKTPYFKSKSYDNSAPRPLLEKLQGPFQRANWAQANAFEALPGFIAAVIVAHLAGAEQATIDLLAMVFIAARVTHGLFYIKDLATLRSLSWFVGMACVVGLFVAAY